MGATKAEKRAFIEGNVKPNAFSPTPGPELDAALERARREALARLTTDDKEVSCA